MSVANKYFLDLLKVCSVLPALVIIPAYATDTENNNHQPATSLDDVVSWSNLNYTAPANTDVYGGILKISGNTYADTDIDMGIAENNHIFLSRTEDAQLNSAGNDKDVPGQGSVLYNNGAIKSISGTFRNNTITNISNFAAKASVNGGVFALYRGTNIGTINGDFTNNVITSKYNGSGETEYKSGGQISAGGGAIHIEGQYGSGNATKAHIGTINGNFANNAAVANGYANGGAIYIKGGADRDGQTGADTSIGLINGNFTGNYVQATTNTTNYKKASTGGAISVKRSSGAPNGAFVNVVGNFDGNYVKTNGTDAFGGAIYNEGTTQVTGNFDNNFVQSESGAGWGGAVYNAADATFTINGASYIRNNSAAFGGAIWNDGTLVLNNADRQISFYRNITTGGGGAIYNSATGYIEKINLALFQSNRGNFGGAINNSGDASSGAKGKIDSITGSSFIANNGKNGGAIRNQGSIGAINGVLFMDNKSENGGALWNGTLGNIDEIDSLENLGKITNTQFKNNSAINGLAQGGAITNAGVISDISDVSFSGNYADKLGGAIANVNPGGSGNQLININGALFSGNSAGENGGAIYNADRGIISFTGDNVFASNIAAGVANDIYNLGTINIKNGTTKLSGGINGTGSLNVQADAVLNIGTTIIEQEHIKMDGTLNATIINADAYGRLVSDDVQFGATGRLNLTVGAAGRYNVLGNAVIDIDNIDYNKTMYNISVDGQDIIVKTNSVADIATDSNISNTAAAVLVGLANSNDYAMNFASLNAQTAMANNDVEYIESETSKLSADEKPVVQAASVSVQNQIATLAANRMSGGIGRSGGDITNVGYGVWAQGMINQSKFADKFRGNTFGLSVGADSLINKQYIVGVGYAYNNSDVDSGSRNINIASNSIFAYAQYQPSQWYFNATLNYTMSDYIENITVFGAPFESSYDVSSFGAQTMTGYDFATGITPSVGLRYLYVSQDAYNNGMADISATDTDYLTGVAGLEYAFEIQSDYDLKFSPNIRAAATYDFLSDAVVANVAMPGMAAYVVNGESLSRFGSEFGIGLTMTYRGVQVSANYDLDLHKNYTSHTGMLKIRYNF